MEIMSSPPLSQPFRRTLTLVMTVKSYSPQVTNLAQVETSMLGSVLGAGFQRRTIWTSSRNPEMAEMMVSITRCPPRGLVLDERRAASAAASIVFDEPVSTKDGPTATSSAAAGSGGDALFDELLAHL
jgi:hypothetical protein